MQSVMAALPDHSLTVDEFLVWSEATPGRFELLDGCVYEMRSERAIHADTKFAVQRALADAIDKAGVPCRAMPDGMTVRINARTAFEPDALVYCGPRLPPDVLEVREPVIVVQVLSPPTQGNDFSAKLEGYFLVPSISHYLIVAPEKRLFIHHARQPDGKILTQLVRSGTISMSPPGIDFSVDGLLD